MTADEALELCVKALKDIEWARDDDDGYACCPSCQASRSQKYSRAFVGKHDEGCMLGEALAAAAAYAKAQADERLAVLCQKLDAAGPPVARRQMSDAKILTREEVKLRLEVAND
jgi:hypothetical protein